MIVRDDMGEILEKNVLIMRIHIGTATSEEGEVFTMSTNMDGSPLIEHEKSGRKFSLSWQEIIDLALARGITGERVNTYPEDTYDDFHPDVRSV